MIGIGVEDFVATILLSSLVYLNHFYAVASSSASSVYLLLTTISNLLKIRTFSNVFLHSSVLVTKELLVFELVFYLPWLLTVLLLSVENVNKSSCFIEEDLAAKLPPEEMAPPLSKVLVNWLFPLLMRGSDISRPLAVSELPEMDRRLSGKASYFRAQAVWDHQRDVYLARKSGKEHGMTISPLLGTILSVFWPILLRPAIPNLLVTAISLLQPYLIGRIIGYLNSQASDAPEDAVVGTYLAWSVGIVLISKTLLTNLKDIALRRSSVTLQGFLREIIYRKSLRMDVDEMREVGTGMASNMITAVLFPSTFRTESPLSTASHSHMGVLLSSQVTGLYSAVIAMIFGLVLLWYEVGAAFVAPLLGAVVFLSVTPHLSRPMGPLQAAWRQAMDKRSKLLVSVLKSIRTVKLSSWELPLIRKIQSYREVELDKRKAMFFRATLIAFVSSVTGDTFRLLTILAFTIICLLTPSRRSELNVEKMFTVVSMVQVIGAPLIRLGQDYGSIVQTVNSVLRIEVGFHPTAHIAQPDQRDQEFLLRNEKRTVATPLEIADLTLQNATYKNKDGTILLADITTSIRSGKLTMVVGKVGSGKSLFLQALLEEVVLSEGKFSGRGGRNISYCSQDAWLRRSESIRTNIQFMGSKDQSVLYDTVLRAVALDVDLATLKEGDETLTATLSGGQSQRVALARALYAQNDIYLLDDTLSALDVLTEEHVFRQLFDKQDGLLRDQTVSGDDDQCRHRLPRADWIILMEGQTIVEQGTYEQLLLKKGHGYSLLKELKQQREVADEKATKVASVDDGGSKRDERDVVTKNSKDLDVGFKTIPSSTYWNYYMSAGIFNGCLYYLGMMFTSAFTLAIPLYQARWFQSMADHLDTAYLLTSLAFYVVLELGFLFSYWGNSYNILVRMPTLTSKHVVNPVIENVLLTSLSFFENQPIGRIITRFSSDVMTLDFMFPGQSANLTSCEFNLSAKEETLMQIGYLRPKPVIYYGCVSAPSDCFPAGLNMIAQLVLVIIAVPKMWIPLGLLFLGLWFIQRFYNFTSQSLRRLSASAVSPLNTLFSETVDPKGLISLRAFGCEEELITLNSEQVNVAQRTVYLLAMIRIWLSSALSNLMSFIAIVLVVVAVSSVGVLNPAVLAVAILQVFTLSGTVNYVVLAWTELQIAAAALDRLQEYKDLEPEDAPDCPPKPVDWPSTGKVEFRNVSLSYGDAGHRALNNLSFTTPGGTRIGICGRTGAGKTSLFAALFRLQELESGKILIDNVDITTISKRALRSSMSVIPQDPLLLDTTLRENLDIESQSSDADIWKALDSAQLKNFVEELPQKLDTPITGEGGTLSRGQRQLLALVRSLISGKRIICFDEATSSIDHETQTLVQRVLKDSFDGCTTLTIAHRISTLIEDDLILVLDNGELAEYGSPKELLKRENSVFRKLAKEIAFKTQEVNVIEEQ
ncbi:P-loop containing nucleoside triphosphate hydrolase protein [Atractiella rhizophila]|nr:P-loop containing nucleoside triphosphate hydrolase protein [Atractiella rhizophila]